MNEVGLRKCLTHSALVEDSATGALLSTKHPLGAVHAGLEEEPPNADAGV